MSCWNSPKSTSSYVTKLDLTLCRPKVDVSQSPLSQTACRDHGFGTASDSDDSLSYGPSSTEGIFPDGCCAKPGGSTGKHCSRLDITLEQKDRRKNPLKSPKCTCSSTTTQPHMPWRYSSSCSGSQGSQHCLGQGGFVHDHGCGFTNCLPKKSTSPPSADNHSHPASFPTVSKSQSSWTSRLDVVLSSNSAVSRSQIGKPHTIFTSCSSEQQCKEYVENVPHMSNIKGVKMYISSCSLTVQPLRSKCQGGGFDRPVLLMPEGDNSTKQYSVGFQTPQKRFMVSEAPTLQITQFQLTRSPADSPTIAQTSTRDLWISPERIPRVSGTPGTPEMVPNVLVFQRSCSSGCKTNLYPVLIPTQQKTSKVSLVIGSTAAPVPVQIIHEYSRSPTPAFFISHGDQPTSSEGLGSGYLLSVNPIACSRPKHAESLRSNPVLEAQPGRCKPAEPYFCHASPCTVVPRVQHTRDCSAPINISIEAFENQRGAVKISISHSRGY